MPTYRYIELADKNSIVPLGDGKFYSGIIPLKIEEGDYQALVSQFEAAGKGKLLQEVTVERYAELQGRVSDAVGGDNYVLRISNWNFRKVVEGNSYRFYLKPEYTVKDNIALTQHGGHDNLRIVFFSQYPNVAGDGQISTHPYAPGTELSFLAQQGEEPYVGEGFAVLLGNKLVGGELVAGVVLREILTAI